MFHEKLKKIAGKYDSVLAFSKIVGMSHVMLGHALKGKRNLSQVSWKKILMNSEGMSLKEANDQIAEWQMEEASQKLGHNGKEIADRIRAAVEEQGASKTRLGEALGTHPRNTDEAKVKKYDDFIEDLESGSINFYYMEAISAFLRKSVSDFLGRSYYPEVRAEVAPQLVGRTVSLDSDDFVQVPFIGKVSCGPLSEYIAQSDETRSVRKNKLIPGKQHVVLEANGLSMINAGILPGDEVVVALGVEPQNGKIYVFSLHGELALGYYFRKGDTVEIQKGNKDYPNIPIDDEAFRVEGMVIAKISYF